MAYKITLNTKMLHEALAINSHCIYLRSPPSQEPGKFCSAHLNAKLNSKQLHDSMNFCPCLIASSVDIK